MSKSRCDGRGLRFQQLSQIATSKYTFVALCQRLTVAAARCIDSAKRPAAARSEAKTAICRAHLAVLGIQKVGRGRTVSRVLSEPTQFQPPNTKRHRITRPDRQRLFLDCSLGEHDILSRIPAGILWRDHPSVGARKPIRLQSILSACTGVLPGLRRTLATASTTCLRATRAGIPASTTSASFT